MKQWKTATIDFKGFWNNDSLSIQEKGVLAAKAIQKVFHLWPIESDDRDYLLEIMEAFTFIGEDDEYTEELTSEDAFNSTMNDLYDFCDANNIWVKTSF